MSEAQALHAQIAQRLFRWAWHEDAQLWRDPDGVSRDAATFRRRLPAYTTDPAATARVWQWLEQSQGETVEAIYFEYYHGTATLVCLITCTHVPEPFEGTGASWPEALCRAALALAEGLEGETT